MGIFSGYIGRCREFDVFSASFAFNRRIVPELHELLKVMLLA